MAANLTRKALLAGAAGAALEAAVGSSGSAAAATGGLRPAAVTGALPLTKPGSPLWSRGAPLHVPLHPQQMVPPFAGSGGVSSLTVRALWNGRQLGLRLEWDDAAVDNVDGLYRFHDAVAVMLPVRAVKRGAAPPPFTMGAPGATVHILQWRASWQHDLERRGGAAERVAEIFPNVIRDEPPQKLLPPKVAELWSPALHVGNPLASLAPPSAVDEVVAAGFGSTTQVPQPSAQGWGTHRKRGWVVSVGLPAHRRGVGDALRAGSVWPVAFAVWLGSADNRGARKHWANWVNCTIPGVGA